LPTHHPTWISENKIYPRNAQHIWRLPSYWRLAYCPYVDLFIVRDNSCEINVMDLFEKKDIRADKMFKTEVKDTADMAGKYLTQMRKGAQKRW
jgi:hypothetical protein